MPSRESNPAPVSGRYGAAVIVSRALAVLWGWLVMGALPLGATALPEPGWVMQGEIAGLVPTNRPEVRLRATRGGETVLVPLTLYLRDGVPQCWGEVPMESRFPGDAPTPGRLPLGTVATDLVWTLQVNGVDLPVTAAGGMRFGRTLPCAPRRTRLPPGPSAFSDGW
jgi:hypothetical protein